MIIKVVSATNISLEGSPAIPDNLVEWLGVYDPATHSPAIVDGDGDEGAVYDVAKPAAPVTRDFGSGPITFASSGILRSDGSLWFWRPAEPEMVTESQVVTVNATTAGQSAGSQTFTLAKPLTNPTHTVILREGYPAAVYGQHFTVSGDTVTWIDTEAATKLTEGENLQVVTLQG